MGNQYTSHVSATTDDQVIPVADFFTNPDRAVPKLSPNGKWLSYLAPAPNEAKNLQVFIQPLDQFRLRNGKDIKQITHHATHDIRTYKWTLDSSTIVFLQDKNGDEGYHMYSVDVATGVEKDLTPFDGIGVGTFSLNQTWFIESKSHPRTGVIALNKQDRRRFDIYTIDLQTGALDLHLTMPDRYEYAVVDVNLQVRAVSKIETDGSLSIAVRDMSILSESANHDSRAWNTIMTSTSLDNVVPLAWTPQDRLLLSSSVGREVVAVVELDPVTKTETVLLEGETDAVAVKVHPSKNTAQFGCCTTGRDQWVAIDPSLKLHMDRVNKYLKTQDADMELINFDNIDDRIWSLKVVRGDKPPAYVLYHLDPHKTGPTVDAETVGDSDAAHFEYLFSANSKVAAYKLGRMESINYTARDGLKLQAYLTYPPDFDANSTYPLVLLPHGGPWTRNFYGYSAWTQWLASRNYLVLQPNYRGSTGFTKTVLSAGFKQFGKAMQTDLLDAVDYVTKELKIVDREHVAIFGGSHGGYCALAGVTLTPEYFTCAIDIVGMSNLKTFLARTPAHWDSFLATFPARMGHPEHDSDLLEEVSPLNHVEKIVRPLMIAQGRMDPRVAEQESEQIVEAIAKRGGNVYYVLYPDEGHGFSRPVNRIDHWQKAELFLSKFMGPKVRVQSGLSLTENVEGATAEVRIVGAIA
ncbi:Alpha/Beta hydrolase protein [Catenaria anguillulae PL171]|uniref:Dipeptidyl-peptidase V n=1 Tax=Catenaria anguillulae PL171 TaxID=765915 RepID=A0A1Y2I4D8_9FUNG|nr:Alpha/Beta hydrolase protein [Catenaria anguillulae PL171]